MSELKIEIVRLEPTRMISSYGFGPEPEGIAHEKMQAFLHQKGLLKAGGPLGTFGFNNPDSSSGSPNYGYEIWFPVDNEITPEGDLRVVNFSGGLYAVANFKNLHSIGEVWGELAQWRESSKYQHGHHQWLEELLSDPDIAIEEYVFNLYLPITE